MNKDLNPQECDAMKVNRHSAARLKKNKNSKKNMAASTLIEPWLSVSGGAKAVEFYKTAFDATEVFHLEDPDGNVVSRLSINGATFWLSDGPANEHKENIPVRMIVTVEDPDTVFAQVIKAGADEVFPVSEEHGWRVGRLVDPFGHHWEIGKQVSE